MPDKTPKPEDIPRSFEFDAEEEKIFESLLDLYSEPIGFDSSNIIGSKNIEKDPMGVIGADGARKRDKLYTELLKRFSDNYADTKQQTKWQKTTFFIVILVLLTGLLVSGIVLLYLVLNNCSACNIAIVIGASVDIVGSFIAIPTIIARHLFPEKIDNDVIKVVKLLVENDKNVREINEQHNLTNKKK